MASTKKHTAEPVSHGPENVPGALIQIKSPSKKVQAAGWLTLVAVLFLQIASYLTKDQPAVEVHESVQVESHQDNGGTLESVTKRSERKPLGSGGLPDEFQSHGDTHSLRGTIDEPVSTAYHKPKPKPKDEDEPAPTPVVVDDGELIVDAITDVQRGELCYVTVDAAVVDLVWTSDSRAPLDMHEFREVGSENRVCVIETHTAVESLLIVSGVLNGKTFQETFEINIEGAPDPDPDPTPVPPGPSPQPDIKTAGVFVLLIEDRDHRNNLSEEQSKVLFGNEMASLLDNACAKDAKGRPAWRLYDDEQPLLAADKAFADLMAAPRKTVPSMAIANEKGGEVIEVTDLATAKALLEKYSKK